MDDQSLMKLQRQFSFVQIEENKTHFSETSFKHKALFILLVLEKESKKTARVFFW